MLLYRLFSGLKISFALRSCCSTFSTSWGLGLGAGARLARRVRVSTCTQSVVQATGAESVWESLRPLMRSCHLGRMVAGPARLTSPCEPHIHILISFQFVV